MYTESPDHYETPKGLDSLLHEMHPEKPVLPAQRLCFPRCCKKPLYASIDQSQHISRGKSAVTSHYGKGNIIDTVYGTTIDLIDTALIVPIDLYKSLANLANCNQESRRLSVCLGYGLRTVNADGSASITAGTRCPLYNTISLDIKAHRQLRNTKGVHPEHAERIKRSYIKTISV